MSEVHEVPYPFFQETVDAPWEMTGEDFTVPTIKSWRPGCSFEELEDIYGSFSPDWYADGMGHMVLTVIQRVNMPKPYPGRVFYTRQWRDPSGKLFGNKKLRIATTGSFNRLLRGYRHPFSYEPRAELVDAEA